MKWNISALARDMQVHHDIAPPNSPEDFTHMPQTPRRGEQATTNGSEPCGVRIPDQHCSRPKPLQPGKRVCCVTSGVILHGHARGPLASARTVAHILLPIYNSSV
jgi:hypothetical protein